MTEAKGIILDRTQIKRILPHREPMLLIDSVTELKAGSHIAACFFIDPEWNIFKGHFPGDPVLPGVYAVECMAQAADILLLSLPRYAGMIPLFIGIDNVSFIKKIKPGDEIEIRAVIAMEREEKAIVTCSAEIYRKDGLAAKGDVTLAMRR